jgi:glyoxylase-like metal-dependent hydrolase (beta-lactamase superfamily II)
MEIKNEKKAAKKSGCFKLLMIGLVILALLVLAGGVAVYLLFYASPVPETSQYALDMGRVRQMAVEGGQPLPLSLNTMIIAEGGYPSALVVAGSGFQTQRMVFPVFQVVYPDSTVIVDTAHSLAVHQANFPGQPFYQDKAAQLQEAMRKSRLILVTHEHFDHLGGLGASPYLAELRDKVRLTREQIATTKPDTGLTAEMLASFKPLDFEQYVQVAPGMVMIKAAGHTPGSVMVYIKLQNGAEFLLVGDVVWNMKSVEQLTGRSWMASLALGEDRQVHGWQIRTLYNLYKSDPVKMIVSHDGEQIEGYIKQGLIGATFK